MSNSLGEEARNELLRLLAREKVFDPLDSPTRRRIAAGVVNLCRHLGCDQEEVFEDVGEYLEICPYCSSTCVTFRKGARPGCDEEFQRYRPGWWNGRRLARWATLM